MYKITQEILLQQIKDNLSWILFSILFLFVLNITNWLEDNSYSSEFQLAFSLIDE